KLLNQSKEQKGVAARLPELEALENRLRTRLATQVRIRQGRNKGRLEIEYYSEDDLDRLTKILEAGLEVTRNA
ncbi:hypothetical protein ACFL6S_15180, partial [Candidatus Poribacteria bacterium]